MDTSNEDRLTLNENQANRLMRLFGHPYDRGVQGFAESVMEKARPGTAVIWHPTLTDLHEQVVHQLNPVLVDTRHLPGDPSPTLSLTLLDLPASMVANRVDGKPMIATQIEQVPNPKPTL